MPADWQDIENQLVHSYHPHSNRCFNLVLIRCRSVPYPVYFATEDDSLRQMRESLAQSGESLSSAILETLARDAWLLSAPATENEKVMNVFLFPPLLCFCFSSAAILILHPLFSFSSHPHCVLLFRLLEIFR